MVQDLDPAGERRGDILTKDSKDFLADYTNMQRLGNFRVKNGCAINTVLISNLDMQELVWCLEERSMGCEGFEEEDWSNVSPICAVKCKRQVKIAGDDITGAYSSNVTSFSVQQDRNHLNFRHVFMHQRHILANVSKKTVSQVEFLNDVRNYVTDFTFTHGRVYPFAHLFLTVCALFTVLMMAYDMYSQLEINNKGQWALTIFIATIFNGFNTSWYLDYWPSYIFKLRRYATNA